MCWEQDKEAPARSKVSMSSSAGFFWVVFALSSPKADPTKPSREAVRCTYVILSIKLTYQTWWPHPMRFLQLSSRFRGRVTLERTNQELWFRTEAILARPRGVYATPLMHSTSVPLYPLFFFLRLSLKRYVEWDIPEYEYAMKLYCLSFFASFRRLSGCGFFRFLVARLLAVASSDILYSLAKNISIYPSECIHLSSFSKLRLPITDARSSKNPLLRSVLTSRLSIPAPPLPTFCFCKLAWLVSSARSDIPFNSIIPLAHLPCHRKRSVSGIAPWGKILIYTFLKSGLVHTWPPLPCSSSSQLSGLAGWCCCWCCLFVVCLLFAGTRVYPLMWHPAPPPPPLPLLLLVEPFWCRLLCAALVSCCRLLRLLFVNVLSLWWMTQSSGTGPWWSW